MTGRLSWIAICVGVALGVTGCARNAVFELELDLPPQPGGIAPIFAVVQVRNDGEFGADWSTVPRLPGMPLSATCARPAEPLACDDRELAPDCSAVVSVIGDGADFSRRLRVRVRFCEDPECAAANDATAPETRVDIERALYQGRYTQGRVCIDTVPTSPTPEPVLVDRCAVRCRDGAAVMHCRADGSHFCEDP